MRSILQMPVVLCLLLALGGLALAAEKAEPSSATPPKATTAAAAAATATQTGTSDEPRPASKTPADGDEEVKTAAGGVLRKLAKGGWTMVFLAALSVMGGAFALERLFRLRRRDIVPEGLATSADSLWAEARYGEALGLCESDPSTLGRVLAFIIRHRSNPMADVAKTAGDLAATELKRHLQRTYPIAVVATLSPLLGLLGTVFGMIDAFDMVAVAGALGDATLLADGISKALITTAVGLCIAIPALALYHYFKSRTTLYGVLLEEQVTDLMSRWLMKQEVDHAG